MYAYIEYLQCTFPSKVQRFFRCLNNSGCEQSTTNIFIISYNIRGIVKGTVEMKIQM